MCFFFFQAEDGIRDLVRSRGLGDVYKRQMKKSLLALTLLAALPFAATAAEGVSWNYAEAGYAATNSDADADGWAPVSYTHLTLPTSDLV